MSVLAVAVVALIVGLCVGVTIGNISAQKSAILRSDCSTPHHMLGGFYYIVPESKYVRMREISRP